MTAGPQIRVVVLISGNGSNLQAIIDAARLGTLPVKLAAVVSNRPDAFGLQRAERAGIEAVVVESGAHADRAEYDRALAAVVERYAPDLLVLAGFMRILGADFIRRFRGRIINIHPSLLPKYRGLNTHRRVLASGDAEHGASVHFVTPELDSGPVIVQAAVPVDAGDDEHSLQQKVHRVEHRILPTAIGWFAEGRLRVVGDQVLLDGRRRKEQYIPVMERE